MPTKTKAKPQPQKAAPAKPKTVIEQIIDLVDKHIAVTDAILKDYSYATEEDMDLELKTANENLKSAVEEFDDLTGAEKFYKLIEELGFIHKRDFDAEKIIELLSDKDIDSQKLLTLIDTDAVENYFINKGYSSVKLNSLADREKLETFLKTEIYPNYRDQESYIFL